MVGRGPFFHFENAIRCWGTILVRAAFCAPVDARTGGFSANAVVGEGRIGARQSAAVDRVTCEVAPLRMVILAVGRLTTLQAPLRSIGAIEQGFIRIAAGGQLTLAVDA